MGLHELSHPIEKPEETAAVVQNIQEVNKTRQELGMPLFKVPEGFESGADEEAAFLSAEEFSTKLNEKELGLLNEEQKDAVYKVNAIDDDIAALALERQKESLDFRKQQKKGEAVYIRYEASNLKQNLDEAENVKTNFSKPSLERMQNEIGDSLYTLAFDIALALNEQNSLSFEGGKVKGLGTENFEIYIGGNERIKNFDDLRDRLGSLDKRPPMTIGFKNSDTRLKEVKLDWDGKLRLDYIPVGDEAAPKEEFVSSATIGEREKVLGMVDDLDHEFSSLRLKENESLAKSAAAKRIKEIESLMDKKRQEAAVIEAKYLKLAA